MKQRASVAAHVSLIDERGHRVEPSLTLNDMYDKFNYGLGDIADTERHLVQAQQRMIAQASDVALRQMLEQHLGQSQQQIENIDHIRRMLHVAAADVEAVAAEALIEQGNMLMQQSSHFPALLDTVIADQQFKIEQLEIGCYRTLITVAQAIGLRDAQVLLQHNLAQEELMAEQIASSAMLLAQAAIHPGEQERLIGQAMEAGGEPATIGTQTNRSIDDQVDPEGKGRTLDSLQISARSGGAAGGSSAGMTPAIYGSGAGPAPNEPTWQTGMRVVGGSGTAGAVTGGTPGDSSIAGSSAAEGGVADDRQGSMAAPTEGEGDDEANDTKL